MEKRCLDLKEEIYQLLGELSVNEIISNLKIRNALNILSDGLGIRHF